MGHPIVSPAPAHARPGGAPPRVALAHDWLCGYRGGEAVLDAIARVVARTCDIAGLYVMFDDRRPLTPAIDAIPRVVSRIGRLPLASTRLRRWLLPLYPAAVGDLSRRLAADHAARPIDVLISTSSAAIKGLRPPPGVPHVCYIHSPARYVWSRGEEYRGGLRGLGLRLYRERFKRWDRETAGNVTTFIANSGHTAEQVRRCYGRDATVIHPPVRTEYFTPDAGVAREDFWLVVSALEPYKRVDAAIAAARLAGVDLVIAGDGSQRRALERLASEPGPGASRVRFLGRVGDEQLRDLYRRARLLVFPQVEDFGIVAAEALACGLPVIARRAGGALDIVEEGITGAFFDTPVPLHIIDAAKKCPRDASRACRESAARFAEEAFDASIRVGIASGGAASHPVR